MTTRVRSIAEKCETEEGASVYKQKFRRAEAERLSAMRLSKSVEGTNAKGLSTISYEIAKKIVQICHWPPFYFSPLAVICLSSAWAESHHVQGDDAEWDTWASHVLGDGFLSTPSLKPLVQSLCLGFNDLSVQLRTCLLYCTIYPPGYMFEHKGRLLRKWVAEGFVSRLEVAEAYFDKLEVAEAYFDKHVSRYQLHRCNFIMRAFLVCKAKEDNFIAYDGAGNSSHAKQIRHLSLSTDRCPDEDVLSHTRSLVVSGKLDGVPFKAFKKLRLLEIHNSSRPENGHLVDICGLIWLKYLVLMDCDQITELPREIGRLQNLETLYVAGTGISKLPTEFGKLQHLETLDVSRTKVTELPTWIEKLKSLKTLDVSRTEVTELSREMKNLERLETLDVSYTKITELPTWIQKLQSLKTLDVSGTKVRELSCSKDLNPLLSVHHSGGSVKVEKLMSPLGVISSSGGEEVIISSSEAKCRDDLSILILFNHFCGDCKVLPVRMLRVAGRHMKVPQWVKQDLCNVCSLDIRLCKLVEEDLEFLKTQMPKLQALQLRFEVLPREPVAITSGGFPMLETFYVDCRLPRVITFGEGAMPKLKHLEFKFYTGTASQDYSMGIKHLGSLETVVFRCSQYYTSDGPGIRETIDVLRKEAFEHPNYIRYCVNDMLGANWISASPSKKAIVQKREQLFKAVLNRGAQFVNMRYNPILEIAPEMYGL